MKKICFIAPSGYGKSTAVRLLSQLCKIKNIKIAEPLYDLQKIFYDYINTKMIGEQDGELLQFLGAKIRKHNQTFLIEKFTDKLNTINDNDVLITNDDCRPPDYEKLKKLSFVFVGINGYCRNRMDQTKADPMHNLEWQKQIKCDYYIDNFKGLRDYKIELKKIIKEIYGNINEK